MANAFARGMGFTPITNLPNVGNNSGGSGSGGNSNTGNRSSGGPCPCTNCREDVVVKQYYLRKTRASADDIQVNVNRRNLICPSNMPPVTECEEKLQQIRQRNGLSGLSGCASCNYSKRM